MMSNRFGSFRRLAVVFSLVALVAAAHIFRIGSTLQGEWYTLYYSYFSDFILPFTAYFFLCMEEVWIPFLRRWGVKLAIAVLAPSLAETCQYFGIPVLGETFDLMDYAMYAGGAFFAVVIDTQVFPRIFDFWRIEKA